jgi:hypothetical protein
MPTTYGHFRRGRESARNSASDTISLPEPGFPRERRAAERLEGYNFDALANSLEMR